MPKAHDSVTLATINQQIQAKLAKLAELVSLEQYVPDGPPKI